MNEKKVSHYTEAWEKLEESKKIYEASCKEVNNARAAKSDQIAEELYNFVNTNIENNRDSLKNFTVLNTDEEPYGAWLLLFDLPRIRQFSSLLDLAIDLRNNTINCQKVVEKVRKLSDHTPGYKEKDIVGAGIKVGLITLIILVAIAGIITGAIFLANPTFLMLLILPVVCVICFALLEAFLHGTERAPFSDFYKTGFSRELDECADRIQNIINSSELDSRSVLLPTKKTPPGNPFGGIYQPAPKEPEKPTGQPSSIRLTPTKTDSES